MIVVMVVAFLYEGLKTLREFLVMYDLQRKRSGSTDSSKIYHRNGGSDKMPLMKHRLDPPPPFPSPPCPHNLTPIFLADVTLGGRPGTC